MTYRDKQDGMSMKIPSHLELFAWYSPHLAWLREAGFHTEHEQLPGDAPQRANLTDAYLRGAYLRGANLRGANLKGADLRGADLTCVNLTGAYLTCVNLTDAILRGANLTCVNLTGAYLTGANMTGANLRGAYLRGANLRGANLKGANMKGANLPFDDEIPTIENIDRRILDAITSAGCSLNMRMWHTCETTHCRAGWAIHIAGEAGKRLEDKFGAGVAGSLIYAKSRPDKPVPDFYASNEDAMDDLVECAAEGGAA